MCAPARGLGHPAFDEEAIATAAQNGMRHVLMVTTEGLVVVSGAPPFEAMAHWHNIEFAARVECMRLDEATVTGGEDRDGT